MPFKNAQYGPVDDMALNRRRRLRAARELAGFENVHDLADEIHERGFGASTILAWEQGRGNPPGPSKLTRVAEACSLDPAWFYIDIAAAIRSAGGGLPASELARRLREVQQAREDPPRPGSTPEADDPPSTAE